MRLRTCVGLLSLFWLACFGFFRLDRHYRHPIGGARTVPQRISTHAPPTAKPPPHHRSRLGPKSEDSRESRPYRFRAVHIWLWIIYFALFAQPAMSARVAADSTPAAGVHKREAPSRLVQLEAKPSGIADIRTQPVFTNARKRAYKRALVRAQSQGTTSYRGRTLTLQQLAGTRGMPASISQPRRPRQSFASQSGIRPSLFVELECWRTF